MSDHINNKGIFKKLKVDTSNQWIFYDERFQKFFDFLANNITDDNILEETEVLEVEDLKKRQEYLDANMTISRMEELKKEYPGLMKHTQDDVENLMEQLAIKQKLLDEHSNLVQQMKETKKSLNAQLSRQEERFNALSNKEKELMTLCQGKAKQLEELEQRNHEKYSEVVESYIKLQSPPLFFHQQPLEQYCLKCDSFKQYFSLYMKENFKILDNTDLDNSLTENRETADKLEKLRKSIEEYNLALITEKAKCHGTQCAIGSLNFNQIHVLSLNDMERETHEMSLVNSHQSITQQTLMADLQNQIKIQSQQKMELTLYENTKQKLERALIRHEKDEYLTKMVSDALFNAELIWIIIQMDLKKIRSRFHTTPPSLADAQHCLQRIQLMNQATKQYRLSSPSNDLITQISQQLSQHLQQQVPCAVKPCMFEYEKFKRLLNYALQALLNHKPYNAALNRFNEIKRLEAILIVLVYDSPVNAPMFEKNEYSRSIFNAQNQHHTIERLLRHLRTQFRENISERLEQDKLWRYTQLLWIWFLTEPRRVLYAIQEAKKAASHVLQFTGTKALAGIKRK